MKKITLGFLVGSLRQDSINLKLAKALEQLGSALFDSVHFQIHDIPLFNQDLEISVPSSVKIFKEQIESCDGIIIVTPEYNRSIPGVLKNCIDWASRPYGKNSFAQKPCALIGTSQGALATACAQQHLKSIMVYLDTHLMGQPEGYIQFNTDLIGVDGKIANPKTEGFLLSYLQKFTAFIGEI